MGSTKLKPKSCNALLGAGHGSVRDTPKYRRERGREELRRLLYVDRPEPLTASQAEAVGFDSYLRSFCEKRIRLHVEVLLFSRFLGVAVVARFVGVFWRLGRLEERHEQPTGPRVRGAGCEYSKRVDTALEQGLSVVGDKRFYDTVEDGDERADRVRLPEVDDNDFGIGFGGEPPVEERSLSDSREAGARRL